MNISYYNNKINYCYNNHFDQELLRMAISLLKNDVVPDKRFELVKAEPERKVYKALINGKSYFLKQYKYRKLKKRVKNIFRKSSACRAFKMTNKLLDKKITVVKPALAVTYRHDFFTLDSLFITEDFMGSDLQSFIAQGNYDLKTKSKVIKQVAKLWADLYNNNFINGDPNLPGVLLKFTTEFKLCLVDVDNIRHFPYLTKKAITNNLAKFNAHSYSGLAGLGKARLSHQDRKLFYNEFLACYNKSGILLSDIKNKTFKILSNWDKGDLI